jgi:serine/threonine-protein kinase
MSQASIGERTWIDAQADRFEREWSVVVGDRPRIEDYLAGQSGAARDRLLAELLRMERELRESAGEKPAVEEYRARFPDDHAVIGAAFGIGGQPVAPAKPSASAAHSLLLGLLALQNNFIEREALLAAFSAWVADKSSSLGQILLDRGALTPARHAVLLELVAEHLGKHGHDPERSLAVLSVVPAVRDGLERVLDLDLQASLLYLGLNRSVAGTEDMEDTASWDEETAPADAEGRFQIVRLHDRGALGEVYLARDQQLHRIVALKRIKLDHAADRDKRARFVVEAEITGRLEHPGIVPVYGLGTDDDGRPFYAMRFIRGDNLKSAIEQFHREETKARDPGQRNLALQKLLRRFLDVCNAIDYAHSRGVLHRDLKPGNIMLGKFGETLVVDWGLAKSRGESEAAAGSATLDERTLVPRSGSDVRGTEFGDRLGTPAYMSPEQAGGRIDELGPSSDVYSLGATLYCLLTGCAPFDHQELPELLRNVERGEFAAPRQLKSWIDPALEAICLKAMAREAARRYSSPRALADDVEHWLADERVSAWREPVGRRLRRWGRRHRLLMTGAAATVLVAVGALALGDVMVRRQRDRAEKNLAFARTVVDEMYTGVAERLEDQKEMDDYQQEILEKALKFYERFALPQSPDPQLRLEAGRAGMRVGGIRSRLGQTAAAEQAYGRALDILRELVSDRPSNPVYRDALAQAHHELGGVFRDELRRSECERERKEAEALWGALARDRPEVAEYRSKLADACARMGNEYQVDGRVQEANAAFQRALALADALAGERPEVGAYQESLARILRVFSNLQHNKLRDTPGSIASCQRAVEITEKLARGHPEVTRYQFGLGDQLALLGHLLAYARKFPQAEAAVKRSIAILEKLAADHPQDMKIAAALADKYFRMKNVFDFRGDGQSALEWGARWIEALRVLARRDPHNRWIAGNQLGAALAERAETWTRLGRLAEALADFQEAVEVAHESGDKSKEICQAFHALTKARLGDLSELALLGDELRRIVSVGTGEGRETVYSHWILHYDAACVHAGLAQLALHDQKRPPAERQRLAEPDLARALELLEMARSEGDFERMIRLEEIQRERLLDPLRANPRFRLLIMDLAFPDHPLGP